jgi:hypothetical protein
VSQARFASPKRSAKLLRKATKQLAALGNAAGREQAAGRLSPPCAAQIKGIVGDALGLLTTLHR